MSTHKKEKPVSTVDQALLQEVTRMIESKTFFDPDVFQTEDERYQIYFGDIVQQIQEIHSAEWSLFNGGHGLKKSFDVSKFMDDLIESVMPTKMSKKGDRLSFHQFFLLIVSHIYEEKSVKKISMFDSTEFNPTEESKKIFDYVLGNVMIIKIVI